VAGFSVCREIHSTPLVISSLANRCQQRHVGRRIVLQHFRVADDISGYIRLNDVNKKALQYPTNATLFDLSVARNKQ
jgi:hypothetical protein